MRISLFLFIFMIVMFQINGWGIERGQTRSDSNAQVKSGIAIEATANAVAPQKKTFENTFPATYENDLEMAFQYIPPGSFFMGSHAEDSQRHVTEHRHRVTLKRGFYMQRTEVTQKQWKTVMGENPSEFRECGEDCPVERVSWNEIQVFLSKLNQMKKTSGYRLPTEAEWEYACRAGSNTPFSSANCLTTARANYNGQIPTTGCPKGEYRKSTVPVASFPPNAWGLYDMHGNVWEWCQDWYEEYPSQPVTDPTGPLTGTDRINRGGGWSSQGKSCRSASRYWNYPDYWDNSLGFRLVYDPLGS